MVILCHIFYILSSPRVFLLRVSFGACLLLKMTAILIGIV